MNEQSISLDVSKAAAISQVVRIGQGDKSGTTIVASIYDNGVALSLSGKTARFNMRLPGGAGYVRDAACTVSGNKITYVVNEQYCASVAGITSEVYFEIMQGTSVIASTQRFSIQVLRSVLDGMEPAESWDNAIDELIERGKQVIEDVGQAASAAAAATRSANDAASSASSAATSANAAAGSARAAASSAEAAASAANDAATSASTAADAANEAAPAANDAAERAEAAIEAMGDISELAVPTMSADVRGGARLGSGLSMSADVLSVIAMTDSEIDAAVDAAFSD